MFSPMITGSECYTVDGKRVYVSHPSADDASVIDTATNTVVDTVAVGDITVGSGLLIGPAFVAISAFAPTLLGFALAIAGVVASR